MPTRNAPAEGLFVQPLPDHLAPTDGDSSAWGTLAGWAPRPGQSVVFSMGAVYWITEAPNPADPADVQIESALGCAPMTTRGQVEWGDSPNLVEVTTLDDEIADHARTVWAALTAI